MLPVSGDPLVVGRVHYTLWFNIIHGSPFVGTKVLRGKFLWHGMGGGGGDVYNLG